MATILMFYSLLLPRKVTCAANILCRFILSWKPCGFR